MEKNIQIIKIKGFDTDKKINEIKIEVSKRLEEIEKHKKTVQKKPSSFRNLF